MDKSLGKITVLWEPPDETVQGTFEFSVYGEVTGANLAMQPSLYPTTFTGDGVETTAHSNNGVTAYAKDATLTVTVPEQAVGTTAGISINLGFPVPVLVTYDYAYIALGG